MTELIGSRVRVHWNLQTGGWSLMTPSSGGRVVASTDETVTLSGVAFHVGESMRQKIVKSGRRKVHAWAWGTLVSVGDTPAGTRVSYNPHRHGAFVAGDDEVWSAERVIFSEGSGFLPEVQA